MYSPFERSVVVVRPLVLLESLFAIVLLVAIVEGAFEKHGCCLLVFM